MTTPNRFRQFFQAIKCNPASVVITDSAGIIEYANPKFTELTGYTLAEAVGKSPRILQSGKTPTRVYDELWACITSGREWRGEFVNRKKNGEIYIEEAYISPVTNRQGVITHFVAVKQDITARREAEEKLAKSYAFLQLAIDTVPEPIMAIDADYRIRLMNSTLRRQLPAGANPDEAPFCYQVSHHRDSPCHGDEHPCPLRDVAARNETIRVEHTHFTVAGEPRYIEIVAAPLPSDDGTFKGIIESSRDITDRRRAEDQLRYRANHDALTGIPNRQLFYDRLRQAIALAKRENKLIGVLFIDLDGFKTVNDTLGHKAGDQLLREVAGRLQGCLRQSDTLARMGGDEFAAILMNIGRDHEKGAVCHKITTCLEDTSFRISTMDCRIGASIGMSVFPEDGDSPDGLLVVADERMYRDKETRKPPATINSGSVSRQRGRLGQACVEEWMEKKLTVSTLDLVECLSTAMDLISPDLANHQRRVGYIALQLAKETGLPLDVQKNVLIAGLLHDCGALAMPNRLQTLAFDLHEENTIDPSSHAEAGYQLTKQFHLFTEVANFIRFHHQPWDQGGESQEVPMAAHVVHLADRIDVLVRGTRHILLQRKAVQEKIDDHNGTLFCPDLVDSFHRLALRESFWLDIANINMGAVIAGESGFAHEILTGQDVLDMTGIFGNVIDFRSRFTATHSSGVSAVATTLASLAGFSEHQCLLMKIAGNLHDLGKLAIPLEIIDKPDKLTDEEFSIVKTHTFYTHKILSHFRGLSDVRQWAACHHEKMDGSGYPFRHHGRQLSLGARLLAVADVFTAITEDRPYRKGMPMDEATTVLRNMTREQALDHESVNLLLDNFDYVNQTRIMAQTQSLKTYQDFSSVLT